MTQETNASIANETLTVAQTLQQAIAQHQAGRLQEAEQLYRLVLQTEPNHPEANHNMGILAVQMQQPAAGLPYFIAALNADPAYRQYWLSAIDVLIQADQLDAAREVLALAKQQGLQGNELDVLAVRLAAVVQVVKQPHAGDPYTPRETLPVSSTAALKSNKRSKTKPNKSTIKTSSHQKKSPSPQEVNTLLALFNEGRYSEATAIAQTITGRFPLYGFGWKALGTLFAQMGHHVDALIPMQKAATLSPNDAEAHYNLGNTLKNLGRLNEAETCYRQALEINPDDAEIHYNLGNTLKALGQLDEASNCYQRVLAIKPGDADACYNLGVTYQELGRLDEAEASYRQTLANKPNFAEAHSNLGNILKKQGRFDEAETNYRQALDIKADFVEAYYNLGGALQEQSRLDEAEASYRRVLEIKPDYAEAHCNLGNTLKELGRLDEAEGSYRRALKIRPDYVEAYYNLGGVLQELGRQDEAEASYRAALKIKPDFAEAHYNLGGALHEQERLDEAEASYRRALEIKPDYGQAHNNLGITLHALGRLDEAGASYRRALEIKPDFAAAHYSLGCTLQYLERLDEAEASYRRALQIKQDYAEAHYNLCSILQKQGRLDEAEVSCRQALECKPDYAEAHSSLGDILNGLGRLEMAEASYRMALQIKPDYAGAHSNLGNILKALNRPSEAEISYRRALEIEPDFIAAHNNLGVLLKELGRLDESEASLQRALLIKPNFAEAHCNLGYTLKELGRLDESEASLRQALLIKPDFAEAYSNLGDTLKGLGRLDEAEAGYRRALQINPDCVEVYNNLGNILIDMGRLNEAEVCFRKMVQIRPDYAQAYNNRGSFLQKCGQLDEAEVSFRRALELKPDYVIAHNNLIFTLDLMVDKDSASLLEERKRWDAAHAAHLYQQQRHSNIPDPERRMRIGYVSADFKDHSAARAFGGILTCYDRSQVEVFAYSNLKTKGDTFTERFRQDATAWRDIGFLSDEAVAKMIREDRIDILVDLSGHSAGNRLLVFAHKPAPIQVTAWGYAAGTGMRAMDVFFADPIIVPPQDKRYFTEEVRYLPSALGSFFVSSFPEVNELPALSNGFVTFGSLNRLTKLSDQTFYAWAQVLLAVPRSRLLLKTPELDDASTRERVVEHFTKAGVAADRILIKGGSSWYEHMQAHHQLDIVLDPFPQGGGMMALEDLMMGVPIINLRGPTLVGRMSASIMTTLGLPDWIAESREHYVELAVRKATDLQSLATLRQQLRGIFSSSVLGDQAAYARAVEQEYRKLWQEWCSLA